MAYLRSCQEETLLVAVNPYRQAATFRFDQVMADAVYTCGDPAEQKDGVVTVMPKSAGIYKVR